MDFNEFATDTVAEIEGKWFPLKDAQLRLARTGNPRYREKLRVELNIHGAAIEKGLLDLELNDAVMIDVLVDTILLDWKGFTEGGRDVPYSKAKAREMLTKFRDFREFVAATADKMDNFRLAEVEEAKGNSKPASSGTSGGATKSNSSEE